MRQTIGTIMLFMSVFIFGGVTFLRFEEYAKLGMLKETILVMGMVALISLFLMTGGL